MSSSCSYVELTNISSVNWNNNWFIFLKKSDEILYIPFGTVKFVWASVIPATLYTNYPDCYSNDLTPITTSCYNSKEHQYEVTLDINTPGNFQIQMKLENGCYSSISYFIVESHLDNLNLSSIVCESVITKLLGPFSNWKSILEKIANLNYNMIHFTPIQERGISKSGYSLYGHHILTNQISEGKNLSENEKEEKLVTLINELSRDKGVYSICDVVWNHTAINSPWIVNHIDATFNLTTSPHLRPAYCLDRALQFYNKKLIRRNEIINTKSDVDRIMGEIERSIIPKLKMWEFFIIDIDSELYRFSNFLDSNTILEIEHKHHPFSSITDNCIIKGDGRRGSKIIRLSCAQQVFSNGNKQEKLIQFKKEIDKYNLTFYNQWNEDKAIILESIRNHITYDRVHPNGPRNKLITNETPLLLNYFTTLKEVPFKYSKLIDYPDLDEDDIITDMKIDGADNLVCANAGWVFGMENTIDITSEKSKIYLRRQLVVWADCIRLRYGNKPSDSPFLWEYMKQYTCQIAKIFHGIRIDNCHSTPIHVAKYLLQSARSVRPNLFVMAELFTDKENEVKYCEQLGLTCLIREAMQSNTPNDLYTSINKYCGRSSKEIGSLFPSSINLSKNPFHNEYKNYIYGKHPRIILFDCTHDNEPPAIKRTTRDSLPNSTLVTMTNCAIGSVFGYDQLVPHRIDVVNEERLYSSETIGNGIEYCKLLLNSLHTTLSERGYNEYHIHKTDNIVMIIRHNPNLLKSVYVIIHSAFTENTSTTSFPNNFEYFGEFVEELFIGIARTNNEIKFIKNKNIINGEIPILFWPHQKPINSQTTLMYNLKDNKIYPTKFPPGSILGFSTKLSNNIENARIKLLDLLSDINIQNVLTGLTLVDLNKILYSCAEEENMGTYALDHWGSMSYCGIAGIILCFNSINENNTISHPICKNLRDGTWLLDYTLNRLVSFTNLHSYMKQIHSLIKQLYPFLIPKYFHLYITKLYHNCLLYSFTLMSSFIKQGNSFVKSLSLCSIQVFGNVKNAPLRYTDNENNIISPSLSAGLPHFSSGYMRTWGRDTFISLRGLMLVTGRYNDALNLITSFASCLRHGMIPNLLASGKNSRFNARDAVWWFLQSIQDYCEFVFNKDPLKTIQFLNETKLKRYFPSDKQEDQQHHNNSNIENSLYEIIREIFVKHGNGISYREWNAGDQIDSHMSDEGFNINVYCDPFTGFIHGGSIYNCGTWMDKMGESIEYDNKGVPSTPRDGADIEIIGLLASTLRWLSFLTENGLPNEPIIINNSEISFTYSHWYSLIKNHFEKEFWIPLNYEDDFDYNINRSFVLRRGIYKDTVGGTEISHDYRFRPNQCVAMVVAPELFNKDHAKQCLSLITKTLLGKLGMKTLDPSNERYSPNYDTNSTNGYYEVKGFNYHQGPEWVWLTGYYLRARLLFEDDDIHLLDKLTIILKEHRKHIRLSPWGGLPELTNKDGNLCQSSCPTQAWSAATILDTLYSIYQI